MTAAGEFVMGYIVNSAWQLPLLLAAGWLGARMLRRMGPGAEHRVWVGALLAAPVLPACSFAELRWIGAAWRHAGAGAAGGIRLELLPGEVGRGGALLLHPAIGKALLAAYVVMLLLLCARLMWGLAQSAALRRGATASRLAGDEQETWLRLCRRFAVDDAEIAEAGDVGGPVTVGVRHRILLVPPGFLARADAGDLQAALAHELAHMARRDYAKNLLYQVAVLPVAFHPAVFVLRARMAESRELVCDEMAATSFGAGREYARSLLRLASMIGDDAPVKTIYAIGIFDANILERRVMNLIRAKQETKRLARVANWIACGLLGVAACGTAMALRMEVRSEAAKSTKGSDHRAAAKENADFVAPKLISQQNPQYPAKARAEKVSGEVILGMTIGEDGIPSDVHVVKSARADLDESAVAAVQQWKFNPATKGGTPVATDIKITVTFSLFE